MPERFVIEFFQHNISSGKFVVIDREGGTISAPMSFNAAYKYLCTLREVFAAIPR